MSIDVEQLVKRAIEEISVSGMNSGNGGIFMSMEEAVEAASLAQKELIKLSFVDRERLIKSMREEAMKNVDLMSRMACEETDMGRFEDKVYKNVLAIEKTPGTEDLQPVAYTGDDGLTLVERSPFGVIGAITPMTNPTETVICNSIGMIAAGNAVVFSPHPKAKDCTNKAIQILNHAIIKAGGPANVLTSAAQPSIKNANIMMNHPKVNMICATGGHAVVKAALSTGKKAIGAGAGNPPALVDETANIEQAAIDIINGCSLDNNVLCIAEKEVIVVDSVADFLIHCMKKHGAYHVTDQQVIDKLEALVVDENGGPNRQMVGKNADYIMKQIGIEIEPSFRVITAETKADHPFVMTELLMPVLPIVRVKDVTEGIALAVKVEQGCKHTAIMHSSNVNHLSDCAKAIQTTIFVKNAPSYAGLGFGGEGHTTYTVAGPTGEGITSAKCFARERRCVLYGAFSIR